ncbi:hypothetical protein EW145_g6684 [Phellinidium pouzarii]|uniref:Uncharacterized protein n=1 Tax=Phellinidium pouzarii TaxID=167371 RepID=A0A4S4KWD5_9AGAM|nr:hypothetical protein EW145_g6684 [Phellinidium pouzarii]
MATTYLKRYADACVQTSPTISATRVNDGSEKLKTPLAHNRLKRVTYAEDSLSGICLEENSVIHRVFPRTPVNRVKTYLAHNGAPLTAQAQTQRRIVSLPDQHGSNALSERLALSLVSNSRSVSMPSAFQRFAGSGDESMSMHASSSFSIDGADYSRLHASPHWTPDLPQTPSPPSTPDSIEIIENSFHLPDAFLRSQEGSKHLKGYSNEDWLSWANSPPRPIPALHGPASLPYARCPSGAEGTVIEEPSTVPGLIWGLGEDGPTLLAPRIQSPYGFDDEEKQVHLTSPAQEVSRPHVSSSPIRRRGPYITKPDVNYFREVSSEHALPYSSSMKMFNATQRQEQLLAHSMHVRHSLKECSDKHNRLSNPEELLLHKGNITNYLTILRSMTETSPIYCSSPNDLKEENLFVPRTSQNHRQVPVERSVPTIPSNQIIQEKTSRKDKMNLDASAPVFVPGKLSKIASKRGNPTNRDNTVITAASEVFKSRNRPYSMQSVEHDLYERSCPPKNNLLPTPPDSTSPLWSSKSSPFLNDLSFAPDQSEHSSENLGLNLFTPSARLEELTDQLRRLTLQQQKNYATLTSLNYDHDYISPSARVQHTPSVAGIRTRSFTSPNLMSKPSMPINLSDLVARQTGIAHTSIVPSPTLALTTLSPNAPKFIDVLKHRKTYSAPVNNSYPSPNSPECNYNIQTGHENIPNGRRHPRSIPFTRLLEKKARICTGRDEHHDRSEQ